MQVPMTVAKSRAGVAVQGGGEGNLVFVLEISFCQSRGRRHGFVAVSIWASFGRCVCFATRLGQLKLVILDSLLRASLLLASLLLDSLLTFCSDDLAQVQGQLRLDLLRLDHFGCLDRSCFRDRSCYRKHDRRLGVVIEI